MSCCAKSMTSVAAPMWTAIEMRMAWSERNDRAPRYPKDCVPKPAADCPLVVNVAEGAADISAAAAALAASLLRAALASCLHPCRLCGGP